MGTVRLPKILVLTIDDFVSAQSVGREPHAPDAQTAARPRRGRRCRPLGTSSCQVWPRWKHDKTTHGHCGSGML